MSILQLEYVHSFSMIVLLVITQIMFVIACKQCFQDIGSDNADL